MILREDGFMRVWNYDTTFETAYQPEIFWLLYRDKIHSGRNVWYLFVQYGKWQLTHPYFMITYPTVTSKMLLPTEEDTAMSPNPFLATITLVIRSGMEVPAARKVKPITWKGSCMLDYISNRIFCIPYASPLGEFPLYFQ